MVATDTPPLTSLSGSRLRVMLANFLLRLSQFISGCALTLATQCIDVFAFVNRFRDTAVVRMIEAPLALWSEGWCRRDGCAAFIFFTLLCFVPLVGSSCDFDAKWSYEERPCSTWNLSLSSDGKPGFCVVDGTDVDGETHRVDVVRNGPPLVHKPPKSTEGEYLYFPLSVVCVCVCTQHL